MYIYANWYRASFKVTNRDQWMKEIIQFMYNVKIRNIYSIIFN